jgi:uncharacterized membrane protein
LAPVLPAWPSAIVYAVSSLVCHQLPERSFYWGSVQMAVCARCTGIYAGAAAAALAAAPLDPARLQVLRRGVRPILLLAAAPAAATVLLEWLGVWAAPSTVRLATGLPLGAAIMSVVAIAFASYPVFQDESHPRRGGGQTPA